MAELRGCSFASGLSAVISNTSSGQMGFVLGTRQGDPNCAGQEKVRLDKIKYAQGRWYCGM
jgi:hypothetical protein